MNNVLILGGILIDKYYIVDQYPKRGTDAVITEQYDVPGGCSLNVAITLENLGCKPYIYSKIGDDFNGEIIEKYMRKNRLDTKFLEYTSQPTEYCLVMVDGDGERTFMTYTNEDRQMSESYADKISHQAKEDDLGNAGFKAVYVTGYFLTDIDLSFPVITLLRDLAVSGVKILFDPGAAVGQIKKDVLREIVKLADIVTPNRYEASIMNQVLDANIDELVKEDSYLLKKDGSNQLTLSMGEQVVSAMPYKVATVDTTGAGDSFAGGLLYGIVNQLDVEESLRVAMACGAITTTFKEPHGKFDLKSINQLMNS